MITLVEVAVYSFLKANINEKVEYIIQLPPGFTIREIQLTITVVENNVSV
jgi:hypothetical protein